jgi:hypothetical protein
MIAFACDGCSQKLKVKDALAGKKGKCPHCGKALRVPDRSREEISPDARTLISADSPTLLPVPSSA